MAFVQFPVDAYIKTFNTGVVERIASFQLNDSTELEYIVLTLLRIGTAAGSERMRLIVYPSSNHNGSASATSDWRELADFTSGANAIGRLRFDFNRQHLSSQFTYYLSVETQNYTRVGETFYLGAKLDWPDDVYTSPVADARGAQIRIIGYR